MEALVAISVTVLVGFAIFLLHHDNRETKRDIEHDRLW